MIIAYVCHPIGHDPAVREANLVRARRWLRWLIATYPSMAFAMPWLPYCQVLDETPDNRDRGIRDDIEQMLRCDAVVLVGGWLSPGMATELRIAKARGLRVIDHLSLGKEPPP